MPTPLETAARDAAAFLLDNFVPSPEFEEEHAELVRAVKRHGNALRRALTKGKDKVDAPA